jgi:hypothetical protein
LGGSLGKAGIQQDSKHQKSFIEKTMRFQDDFSPYWDSTNHVNLTSRPPTKSFVIVIKKWDLSKKKGDLAGMSFLGES